MIKKFNQKYTFKIQLIYIRLNLNLKGQRINFKCRDFIQKSTLKRYEEFIHCLRFVKINLYP